MKKKAFSPVAAAAVGFELGQVVFKAELEYELGGPEGPLKIMLAMAGAEALRLGFSLESLAKYSWANWQTECGLK